MGGGGILSPSVSRVCCEKSQVSVSVEGHQTATRGDGGASEKQGWEGGAGSKTFSGHKIVAMVTRLCAKVNSTRQGREKQSHFIELDETQARQVFSLRRCFFFLLLGSISRKEKMEKLGCYEFNCRILIKAIYFQRYLSTPLASEGKSRCELLHSTYPLHVFFRREMVTWFFFTHDVVLLHPLLLLLLLVHLWVANQLGVCCLCNRVRAQYRTIQLPKNKEQHMMPIFWSYKDYMSLGLLRNTAH